jgi:peptidoglycan/LPS O-acetylase OafA/YrhL
LSDTLAWLAYLAGGGAAFAAVYVLGWRLVPSILVGAVAGLLLWVPLRLMTPREDLNYWFQVDLALNGSFCMIFAGAGAALGSFLRSRRPS